MGNKCVVCSAEVPSSKTTGRVSKWNVIQAGNAGWFFQKDGTAYCPEHVPAWVAEWRANKGTS